MKKALGLFIGLLMIAFAGQISYAGESIDAAKLPTSVTKFVQTHFGKKISVVKAEREREIKGFEYDLLLSNGAKVEFGPNGEWKEIKAASVPLTIVGRNIFLHVDMAHPGAKIVEIARSKRGYEIELNTGYKMYYDSNQRFIRGELD